MKKIYCVLIRHGKTLGNAEKRYIGSKTDEDLLVTGMDLSDPKRKEVDEKVLLLRKRIEELEKDLLKEKYEANSKPQIFSSPMKRCLQTADLIWPGCEVNEVNDFKEIDFGDFEYKNYMELSDNPLYQAWIDSNGEMPFPNGEAKKDFIERNVNAFKGVVSDYEGTLAYFTVHGGSIMAIMSRLLNREYYDFQVDCLDGYELELKIEDGKIDVLSYNRLSFRGNS